MRTEATEMTPPEIRPAEEVPMFIEYVGRWRDRVGCYRPAREVINSRAYAVEGLRDDQTPAASSHEQPAEILR